MYQHTYKCTNTLIHVPIHLAQCPVDYVAQCPVDYVAQCPVDYVAQCPVDYVAQCPVDYVAQCPVDPVLWYCNARHHCGHFIVHVSGVICFSAETYLMPYIMAPSTSKSENNFQDTMVHWLLYFLSHLEGVIIHQHIEYLNQLDWSSQPPRGWGHSSFIW